MAIFNSYVKLPEGSLPEGNCSILPLFVASPSAKIQGIQGAIVGLVVSKDHQKTQREGISRPHITLHKKHVRVGMFYTKKTSYNDNIMII